MKNLLFIVFLSIFFSSYSQTFVDDVDRVAVVVIDYCVDNNGKRYDIKINQEKSNYKHEGWQLGCLEHFKNAKLIYPMKMTNECWQSVYYFVNSKYKTHELPAEERLKCKDFHFGKYKYESPAYSETIINRRKHRQIEKGGSGGRQVYKIKWTENHKYELETIKMPLEKDKHKEGNLISVEIIEILNDKTYLYKAQITKEDTNIVFGLITKL
ncbi:hypothetical protein [Seonamhaeicola marinus]|uniref:Uncharacterized protein n=1 Tax=Seonamhaeicola marinus TaxID=1912246 RepID=A0A5D0HKZ7_9FLAO|nr:hypothetical protein [Seonamhaeicola marinus]TYA71935.1 hypothetical protein FUA24_20515 [Seonamhaeicola marinus]